MERLFAKQTMETKQVNYRLQEMFIPIINNRWRNFSDSEKEIPIGKTALLHRSPSNKDSRLLDDHVEIIKLLNKISIFYNNNILI